MKINFQVVKQMFLPNTYKAVCVKAINLNEIVFFLLILTLSLSSWNCPYNSSMSLAWLGHDQLGFVHFTPCGRVMPENPPLVYCL